MDENPTPHRSTGAAEANQLPETPSLSSHVFQLATAALVYMGAAKLPGTEQVEVNLPLAKLTIDTLDILNAKTEGNRTADETSLFDDVLYQLRLSYVKAESGSPPEPATPPAEQPKQE
jgi:hypothetical protein